MRAALALLVLLLVTAAAGGRASKQVTAEGFNFAPDRVEIAVGDTVTWVNEGGSHNVNFDDGSYRSGEPTTDAQLGARTFEAAGTFQYHCEVHGAPGGVAMSGRVVVTDPSGTPVPSVTPTATPEPATARLSAIALSRRVQDGRLRGSATVEPAGAELTVAVQRRGTGVGSRTVRAGEKTTSFAVRLARAVREKLKDGKRVKVTVTLTATAEGGPATASRTLRLRSG